MNIKAISKINRTRASLATITGDDEDDNDDDKKECKVTRSARNIKAIVTPIETSSDYDIDDEVGREWKCKQAKISD